MLLSKGADSCIKWGDNFFFSYLVYVLKNNTYSDRFLHFLEYMIAISIMITCSHTLYNPPSRLVLIEVDTSTEIVNSLCWKIELYSFWIKSASGFVWKLTFFQCLLMGYVHRVFNTMYNPILAVYFKKTSIFKAMATIIKCNCNYTYRCDYTYTL